VKFEPIVVREICIRAFQASDVPGFVEAVHESVNTVGKWMPWAKADYSEIDAHAWFSYCEEALGKGTDFELGIFAADSKRLLGGAGLNQFNRKHNFCNLGYWVRETEQRKGIASRAARTLAEFAFEKLSISRVEVVIAENNEPSEAVARKIGGLFEAVARNRLWVNGKPISGKVYSLAPK
jgi:ribosomal-protein-serine acetyltransferase